MEHSSFNRSNMRKRGPMESHKLNKIYVRSFHDMKKLYERLDSLKEETASLRSGIRENEMNMSSRLHLIREGAAFLKGGDSRE